MNVQKFDSKKKILYDYVNLFVEINRGEFESYIRQINSFKRPIHETVIRLSVCPWVFVRFIQRRKNLRMGFFRRMISNMIEKIELNYYGL